MHRIKVRQVYRKNYKQTGTRANTYRLRLADRIRPSPQLVEYGNQLKRSLSVRSAAGKCGLRAVGADSRSRRSERNSLTRVLFTSLFLLYTGRTAARGICGTPFSALFPGKIRVGHLSRALSRAV